ncbi:MAG: hypothetical protein R2684_04210 [Pyrinomonadaceae bacterium]
MDAKKKEARQRCFLELSVFSLWWRGTLFSVVGVFVFNVVLEVFSGPNPFWGAMDKGGIQFLLYIAFLVFLASIGIKAFTRRYLDQIVDSDGGSGEGISKTER